MLAVNNDYLYLLLRRSRSGLTLTRMCVPCGGGAVRKRTMGLHMGQWLPEARPAGARPELEHRGCRDVMVVVRR